MNERRWSVLIACLFVSLSLSVTYYYLCAQAAPVQHDTSGTFRSFSGTLQEYNKLWTAWRPRLFSNYLAGLVVPADVDPETLAQRVGAWNAAWFLLLCVLYSVCDERRSIHLVLGTFGAMLYGLTPITGMRLYPWDMPAMFSFALLYVATKRRAPLLVIAIVGLGVGFKETIVVGSLVFLFWEQMSWPRRLAFSASALAAALAVKMVIDGLTGSSVGALTEVTTLPDENGVSLLHRNLRLLTGLYVNHPLFVNAGTFVVFLSLPARSRDVLMWKAVGLAFFAGIMLCGVINEYRIFFEMIPISLWVLYDWLEGETPFHVGAETRSKAAAIAGGGQREPPPERRS